MKYLSLLLFIAALAWTWNLVHTESDISFETHSGIQEKLAALITDTIKARRPHATDILIEKVWTEVLSPQKVKAFFVYSFKDASEESGPVSSQIQGEGILERQSDDGSGNDRWILTKVQTSSDAIQFEEAAVIKSGPEEPTMPGDAKASEPLSGDGTAATPSTPPPAETH